MSQYNNLIEIYQKLYQISNLMPKEMQDGYDECLFQFMFQFKKLPGINYHIENHKLRQELETIKTSQNQEQLLNKIKALEKSNIELRNNVKQLKNKKLRYKPI